MVRAGQESPIKVEVTPKNEKTKYPQIGRIAADKDSFAIKSDYGEMSFWRRDAEKLRTELDEWLGENR